jgi:deazaflavin-dependent oxidoreductase (nitroreductase family)
VTERSLEDDLGAWDKVIALHTTGRRSGLIRVVTIGFLEDDGGSLLVAASSESTSWAANLRAEPRCLVHRDGQSRRFRATLLDEPARASAISRLILKYGTPAERLGAGPAFRLEPAA